MNEIVKYSIMKSIIKYLINLITNKMSKSENNKEEQKDALEQLRNNPLISVTPEAAIQAVRSKNSNVRNYTAEQLLERVRSLDTFQGIMNDFWLIGVRSNEDEFNKFDDKFYLFKGRKFQMVSQGTTNAGSKGLKEFHEYNKDGVAVLKADVIVYNSHVRGISKKRMVYRQNKSWPYYRDNNYNDKSEEIGEVYEDIIHAHIHDVNTEDRQVTKEFINGNSLACQVFAKGEDYDKFMNLTKDQMFLTYALLNEFEV